MASHNTSLHLGMASGNATVSGAREQVDSIRDDLGYPSQEYLDTLDDQQREGLFKLLHSKDRLIGASVVSLAKSLYTSQARFVFELLQNSEDNHYSKALSLNETPQVTFHLYHDRVVQECNEDGFDKVNLAAICNIGKSSKKTSQTYIGEKGIGFKSVFMVAHKAYIQSGNYSFYFQHRPTDNGMGMIAPQWQETEEYLGDHFTRITLSLHDEGTEEELAAQYQMIREQFEKVHEAILLFMSKLKRITIIFYHNKEGLEAIEKTIIFSLSHGGHKTTVTKTITEKDKVRNEEKHYFVSTCLASGLAKNKNRDYTREDLASESYSRSPITLAFPLADTDEPLLLAQWVFAYLPASRMGFKFIIQADFETQANREGIVMTAARNKTLMFGIAEAFIHAVHAMRKVPFLRFKWMRYLPKENDYPWDETWSTLLTHISHLLKETKILEPADDGAPLKYLHDGKQHTPVELDKHGKPLLPDKTPNIYISLQYKRHDLDILRAFGLEFTSMRQIIARAEADLERPTSRIKTPNDEVQSGIARLLTLPFTKGWLELQKEVQKLKMVQLQGGEWCAAYNKCVYFSTLDSADITIPNGLGWHVLESSAESLPDMKHLLELIGVKQASVSDVRTTIARIYNKSEAGTSITATLTLAPHHLQFLYLTDHLLQDHEIYQKICVYSSREALSNPRTSRMYIWNTDPYGVASLFAATATGNNPGSGAPGHRLTYLHSSYFKTPPGKPEKQSLDWKEWLHTRFNIRRMVRLLNSDQTELSSGSKYLARYRPDRFLVFLQLTWNDAVLNVNNHGNIVHDILDARVVCSKGSSEKTVQLKQTYLPLKKLVDLCDRFLIEGDFFPFLKINHPLSHGASPGEWEALGNSFGLGYNENDLVGFLLDLFREIMNAAEERDVEPYPKRIYNLYLYLQAECRQSNDFDASCKMIRQSTLGETVFVPTDNEWDDTVLCVWEAPEGLALQKKYSLTERFCSSFKDFEADKALMADLFVNMLGIAPTCTWQDLVDELRVCKANGEGDFEYIYKLYKCLSNSNHGSQAIKQMRDMFMEEPLIYDPTGVAAWYETSRCLWSSATNIRGMFAVNAIYDDLKHFFINKLGVQTRTVGMVYKKLAGDTTTLDTDEIKTTLMVFSVLLETEGGNFDPKPILEKKLLPVMSPSGELELRTAKQDFVIRDRQHLSDDFAQKAWFLDFNMETVRRLHYFIEWAGLEKRYISEAIKEVCTVAFSSATPIRNVCLQISQKAHALTRIAATFDSPRLQGNAPALYRLFKTSQTLEASSITSTLIINQSGTPISVDKESANLYIPDDASELKIYLTDDAIEQESCFNTKLPRRLAQWIMSEPNRPSLDHAPPQMVAAVQSALSVSRRALPNVLDELGIVPIEVTDDEPETVALPSRMLGQEIWGRPTTAEATSQRLGGSNEPVSIHNHEAFSAQASHLSERATIRRGHSPLQVSERVSVMSDVAFGQLEASSNGYMQLLSHVTEAARRTTFPTLTRSANNSLLESDSVQESNDPIDRFNFSLYHKLERDKRVGAAGELFVFELLLQLLPNFDKDNWASNIRHYVHEHPDYSDIGSWNGGRETSDIVYRDVQGVLTNLLIDRGYLEGQQWMNTVVEYYVEVKSTTNRCKAPFYMSNSQYDRMHEYSTANPLFWDAKRLYVIFRVYNLTQSSIGLNVLVDPGCLAEQGLISFTPDTWSGVIN